MPNIDQSKILILSTNGFEQSELEFPRDQLRAKGATVHVATPDGAEIMGWDGDDWGRPAEADLALSAASVDDYDALVLPGGQINPDLLRVNDGAIELIRAFVNEGKIVAAICHAPWLLVESGVAEGREMTSYHSIKTDVQNAGAHWVDQEIAISNGIITSRSPEDLKAFVSKIVEEVEEGKHARDAA
ncbi:type 1 glutamine amidotransferase domain-containing protein [Ovoidimarina sediminis]|uniref:type 1 glutamine amidotransferase domain-containing protein n=1 Tax=Ovoidimarina sediminis TaxID=3079856 RepID=UPI0029151D99|nr:type 1 glutamine amidotransferase domain-containing protein [Rhodophyticola sp. MJ-SS7]MDU8944896.1 type 1 glutamine amidotransferase domain-containing protein [Rhodophyticola sp. MJ-SS7]